MSRLAVFIVGAVATVAILASLAPRPVHQPVSPATIPASACGLDGAPTAAALIDTAGPYPIYAVRCRDGVQVQWAAP